VHRDDDRERTVTVRLPEEQRDRLAVERLESMERRLAQLCQVDGARKLGHARKLARIEIVCPDIPGIDGGAERERDMRAVGRNA
jgi:hypothetical protein